MLRCYFHEMSEPIVHRCDRCLRTFKAKGALNRHKTKKNQCEIVTSEAVVGRAVAIDIDRGGPSGDGATPDSPRTTEIKGFKRTMWSARDMLRKAGITGFEALDCITTLIIFREIEAKHPSLADPQVYTKEIIDGFQDPDAHLAPFIQNGVGLTFSMIRDHPFDDGNNRRWDNHVRDGIALLDFHPATQGKYNFIVDNVVRLFPLSDSRTTHDLIGFIDKNMPRNPDEDTLSVAFMSVVKDFLDGKELGQFFTPQQAVIYMTNRLTRESDDNTERPLGSVFDPTCGSGSFLDEALKKGASSVYGIELDTRVMALAYARTLITKKDTQHVNIIRDDFINFNTNSDKFNKEFAAKLDERFDTVLANPPFGIKGIKYSAIGDKPNGQQEFPFKTTATGFFFQKIIWAVKIGGMGAVVLPLGKELSSRAPADVKFRRALLRAIDIQEIVVIPAGTFEYTTIRTVVIVFKKIRELSETVVKRTAGTRIVSDLTDLPIVTNNIKLYRLKMKDDVVLPEVEPIPDTEKEISRELLEAHAWALSPDEYKIQTEEETKFLESMIYPMMKLGDLCVLTVGTNITKADFKDGPYPVVGGGISPYGQHNEWNTEANKILISAIGAGVGHISRYKERTYITSNAIMIDIKSDDITEDFLYYMLAIMYQDRIQDMRAGVAQPYLDKIKFNGISIPVPPIDIQQFIASELDELSQGIKNYEDSQAITKKTMHIAMNNYLYNRGHVGRMKHGQGFAEGIPKVKLGDICELETGEYITKKTSISGEFPVYGGGGISAFVNKFNHENQYVIAKDGMSEECVRFVKGKFWLNHHGWAIRCTSDRTSVDYIGNWLLMNQKIIYNLAHGMAQKGITQIQFNNIDIPLPPIDIQNEIAEEMDKSSQYIEQTDEMIEKIKKSMNNLLIQALTEKKTEVEQVE